MPELNNAAPSSVERLFLALVCLTLLAPVIVFDNLIYPTVTSHAFYLRIVIEATLPLYIYLLLKRPTWRPSIKNPITACLTLFVVVSTVSMLCGISAFKSLWGDLERMGGVFGLLHFALFCQYLELIALMGNWAVRPFLLSIVGVGGVLAVGAIVTANSTRHGDATDPMYTRISSSLGNPIILAGCLVIPLLLGIYLCTELRDIYARLLCLAVVALDLICVLFTQTRGAVVGLGVGISVMAFVILAVSRRRRYATAAMMSCAAVAVLAGILLTTIRPPFLTRLTTVSDASSQVRLFLWRTSLQALEQFPILGVGPENYYVIGGRYLGQSVYRTGPGLWVDKPHSAFLEALLTTGVAGAVSFLSLLSAAMWCLYKLWRARSISAAQFGILVAGVTAYEIQAAFAFDTPPGSLTVFAVFGLISGMFLRQHIGLVTHQGRRLCWIHKAALTALALAIVATIYVNVEGVILARDISYGARYSMTGRPRQAAAFFEKGGNLRFVMDPAELGGRYGEFAIRAVVSNDDAQLGRNALFSAIQIEEDAVRRLPLHALSWERLAGLYLTQARLKNVDTDWKRAEDAIRRAIALAPARPEPAMVLVRLKLFRNETTEATSLLAKVLRDFPSDPEAMMQSAMLQRSSGRLREGAVLAQQAIFAGFRPIQGWEIEWLADYYVRSQNPKAAAEIYRLIVAAEPRNVPYLWKLAKTLSQTGDHVDAINAAQLIAVYDPSQQREVTEFVTSNRINY